MHDPADSIQPQGIKRRAGEIRNQLHGECAEIEARVLPLELSFSGFLILGANRLVWFSKLNLYIARLIKDESLHIL